MIREIITQLLGLVLFGLFILTILFASVETLGICIICLMSLIATGYTITKVVKL